MHKYLKYKSYFPGHNADAKEPWQSVNEWDSYSHNNIVRVECASFEKYQSRCDSNPCYFGKCIGVPNDFFCACNPQWTGKTCNEESKYYCFT